MARVIHTPLAREDLKEDLERLQSRIFDISVGARDPHDTGTVFVKALPQDIIYKVPKSAAEKVIVSRKDFVASRRKR